MYALPDGFDFQLLSGCYLEMVCFGVRITKLDFSRPQTIPGADPYKVSICVEGELKYQIDGASGCREFSDSSTSAPLLNLLLQDVVSVGCVGNATLQILFGSGDNLIIEGGGDHDFESYSIYLSTGDILVV